MFTWIVKCWHQKHDFIHVVEATDSFQWRPNGQICVPSPMIKKLNMRTEHYGSLVLNSRPCSGDLLVPCIASLPSVKAGLQCQCFGSSADKVLLISWFTRWRTYNTSSFHLTKIWCKMRWFAKRNFFGHGGWNLFKFSATKKNMLFHYALHHNWPKNICSSNDGSAIAPHWPVTFGQKLSLLDQAMKIGEEDAHWTMDICMAKKSDDFQSHTQVFVLSHFEMVLSDIDQPDPAQAPALNTITITITLIVYQALQKLQLWLLERCLTSWTQWAR